MYLRFNNKIIVLYCIVLYCIGVGSSPALAICETSQVLLAGGSGSFSRGSPVRAFSDLFGKFLVPMKLGKKLCDFGKTYDNLGNKIGKVYLLNWDFSANWECSGSIGNFSANWEKIWYRKLDTVLHREKALHVFTPPTDWPVSYELK